MEQIHQFAHHHLKLSSDREKNCYDHRPVNQHQYDQGDASPQKKKRICPKLMRHFDGPYLVVKRMSDVLYRIQKGSRSKPKVVHYDHLKAYHGPNVLNCLSEGGASKETEPPRASENPVAIFSPGPTSPQSVAVSPETSKCQTGSCPSCVMPEKSSLTPRLNARLPVRLNFLNVVPLSNTIFIRL